MYSIRLATAQDVQLLPAIEAAACKLFDECSVTAALPLRLTPLEDFVEAQQHRLLWVAVPERDEPVGFALVERFSVTAHLEELDVAPAYGRCGMGAALVRAVCKWAAAQELEAVTLTPFRDVPWNAPFYARLGFREVSPEALTPRLRKRIADGAAHGLPPQLRVVMRFNLKPA